ncbi:hypothetical protein COOONC_06987 [Cooperia oncophora]
MRRLIFIALLAYHAHASPPMCHCPNGGLGIPCPSPIQLGCPPTALRCPPPPPCAPFPRLETLMPLRWTSGFPPVHSANSIANQWERPWLTVDYSASSTNTSTNKRSTIAVTIGEYVVEDLPEDPPEDELSSETLPSLYENQPNTSFIYTPYFPNAAHCRDEIPAKTFHSLGENLTQPAYKTQSTKPMKTSDAATRKVADSDGTI